MKVRDNVFEVEKLRRHLMNGIVVITMISSYELLRKTDTKSEKELILLITLQ